MMVVTTAVAITIVVFFVATTAAGYTVIKRDGIAAPRNSLGVCGSGVSRFTFVACRHQIAVITFGVILC